MFSNSKEVLLERAGPSVKRRGFYAELIKKALKFTLDERLSSTYNIPIELVGITN
jgi:hypothetical protein